MKTAVEWLQDCLTEQCPNGSFVWNTKADLEALFNQAKEMEKQQRKEFVYWLMDNCDLIKDKETDENVLWRYESEDYTVDRLLEQFKNK